MIKKLQCKFVFISMAVVTALLIVILFLICQSIRTQMEARSISALQSAFPEGQTPTSPEKPGSAVVKPDFQSFFVLTRNPQGGLEASGSEKYDLTDTALLERIFAAARATGKRTGILDEFDLRFYCQDGSAGLCYAFRDISSEMATMQQMILTCLLIGLGAFVLFFVLMWALAKWMVRPVEEAWNRQRQFVADASHELKTPLTVVLTNAELLDSDEYDAPAKQRFARSIHTMSRQMRGLVESLLELARMDQSAARHQMTAVNLSALAEEAVLAFEAVYFEKDRTLESHISPDLQVFGVESQLRQVVEILLDNGWKYSLAGSAVRLKLGRIGHGRVQLQVASQGEGLTPQQCKDIFKRFYRVDAARKMNHSYGLGLSIAQSIVQQHRGKIWCESKDGINTFYVNLTLHN